MSINSSYGTFPDDYSDESDFENVYYRVTESGELCVICKEVLPIDELSYTYCGNLAHRVDLVCKQGWEHRKGCPICRQKRTRFAKRKIGQLPECVPKCICVTVGLVVAGVVTLILLRVTHQL